MRYIETRMEKYIYENYNNSVYTNDGYDILIDSIENPTHLTLLYNGEKIGHLNVEVSERRFSFDDDFMKYYKVSEIWIDKEHRNMGFGKLLYNTLITHRRSDVKGIYSHLPNRSNKKQIPNIYKKFKSIIENDNEIILFTQIL